MQKMMTLKYFKPAALVLSAILLTGLLGCASNKAGAPLAKAPVEDRGSSTTGVVFAPSSVAAAPVIAPPGIENAGKPGYYTIKQGDTLIRIGLDNGQNWRDLARWNQLDSPSRIEVGQVIRVIPPVGGASAAATTSAPSAPVAIAMPVPMPGAAVAIPLPAPSVPAAVPAAAVAKPSADDLNWIWPTTAGAVIAGFDDVKNKGLDIGGKLGDSVLASADGRVVYAGSGLRGYGNLIIIKHNDTFLSAYAHNQALLVKEDQTVTKGQKIAEMGQSDSDKVKLHFEIRRQGKPVDPAQYLPKR